MRLPKLLHCLRLLLVGAALAPSLMAQTTKPVPISYLSPQRTPAFSAAARRHAHDMTQFGPSTSAGLWIVQDARGRLVASAVLTPFPTSISSENYGRVVPGAAGRAAARFGFARTLATATRPAYRVAFVTLAGT
jgi:hypothetical protein